MSSLLDLSEELINLFQLDLKHIVYLACTCKTLFTFITATKHIRSSYKGVWKEQIARWINVLWDVNLSYTEVTDVSALGTGFLHTLNLSHTKVTDVSTLGKVHTLDLTGTQVTDVSALGKVHTLNLYCTKVTDVSALGKVHTLDLAGTKVTDVSALGNVHTLYLYGIYNTVKGLHNLGN